jgi:hypothetical protein
VLYSAKISLALCLVRFLGSTPLRRPATAILVFFAAPAGARVVATDFRCFFAANRNDELEFVAVFRLRLFPRSDRIFASWDRAAWSLPSERWALEPLRHIEGKRGKKLLECHQICGASEQVRQNLILNARHQLAEHVVSLRFILNQRILLTVAPEINPLTQAVHCVKVLLPEPIDRVQDNVAFKSGNGLGFLVVDFALVGLFDPVDEELSVFLRGPGIKLRGSAG